jgi:hypothetical protein
MAGESDTLSHLLDDVFSLLSYNLQNQQIKWRIRLPPFALFVIGGEARNDVERTLVLEVLERAIMETDTLHADKQPCPAVGLRASGLGYVMELTKRVWIMDDLHDDSNGPLDYGTKLHEALSSCEKLPSLL